MFATVRGGECATEGQTSNFMALALESPLPFSFHAPVVPDRAQVQLALHPLAAQEADLGHLGRSLVRLALRPHPDRQVACLEVYGRQIVRALFRLAPRRALHRQMARQVGCSPVGLAQVRHDAHQHRDRLVVVCCHVQFRNLYCALAQARSRGHQSVRVWGLG